NIYYYPVLGNKVCPQGTNSCDTGEMEQQFFQYSAPDSIIRADVDGTTQEWYQPVQEPGNIFSYPWKLEQITAESDADSGSVIAGNWKKTDTSTGLDKTNWTAGGTAAQTVGTVEKYTNNRTYSASGAIGSKKTSAL